MGFAELVGYLAALMALNALAIDVVLPGLPQLGAELAVADPNRRQLVIVAYLVGMGASQLIHGPLADRIGRRATLLVGLSIYSVAGLMSAIAPSFGALLAARVVQGLGAGAPRVVAVTIARDRYRGPEMARVMSLVMMVFMVVPILAPSLGQVLLLVVRWRVVFGVLAVAGAAMALWTYARLVETLAATARRPLTAAAVGRGFRLVMQNRTTMVAIGAMTLASGGVMAFVTSAQQIFQDTFGAGRAFALLFALIAVTMSAGSFTNARLVAARGPRALVELALHAQIAAAALAVVLALTGHQSLPLFVVVQCLVMVNHGFIGSNLNAIAMEPMGALAGTASSVIGAITTIGAALLGGAVGHQFDGTARPFAIGTLVLAIATRITVAGLGRRS